MNVYDFDNTIYDGESAIDFFRFYLKKDKSLFRYIPSVINALIKYKRGKISVEEALEKYGANVSEYYAQHSDDLKNDMKEFWDGHIDRIKPFYNSNRSDDDLVISCSPEFSLDEICSRLGIKRYIGTAIEEKTGRITRLCFRENKVKAFRDLYPDTVIDNFYTDSINDKPLMDISRNVYLVKGDKIKKIK